MNPTAALTTEHGRGNAVPFLDSLTLKLQWPIRLWIDSLLKAGKGRIIAGSLIRGRCPLTRMRALTTQRTRSVTVPRGGIPISTTWVPKAREPEVTNTPTGYRAAQAPFQSIGAHYRGHDTLMSHTPGAEVTCVRADPSAFTTHRCDCGSPSGTLKTKCAPSAVQQSE